VQEIEHRKVRLREKEDEITRNKLEVLSQMERLKLEEEKRKKEEVDQKRRNKY
jgi:hypothetical protein